MDAAGKLLIETDAKGHATYDAKKGAYVLGVNVVPAYRWFNGKMTYTLLGDKVDKTHGVISINKIEGGPTDGQSLIWPMKIMQATQPYDPVNRTLVAPHMAGDDATSYGKNFSWEKAIASGMKTSGADFSGKVDFLKTEMYWPLNHMVAPREKTLACADCHASGSRLGGLDGIYMPAYNANRWVDLLGWLMALGTLIGVLLHGSLRFYLTRKG